MFGVPYEVDEFDIEDLDVAHYVELHTSIGSKDIGKQERIPERDPGRVDLYVEISPSVESYGFFDRMESTINGETKRGAPVNPSGLYYINGETYDSETIDEAYNSYSRHEGEKKELEELLEQSDSGVLVRTRNGTWKEFSEEDEIITVEEME